MFNLNKPIFRLFTYACLASMSACSSTSKLNVIQQGSSVAFVTTSYTDKDLPFIITNKGVGEDATTGGKTGAVGGAIAGGLLCGPWIIICAPFLALTGAVGGGAVGAVVGSVTGLSIEDETSLTNKVTTFLKRNEPQKKLLTEVKKQASKNFTVVDAPHNNKVSIEIQSLEFHSFSDGKVALSLEATIVVNHFEEEKMHNKTKSYQYQSPPEFVETWLEQDDNFYQQRFNDAYRTIADNIIRTL
jgi:outer membrane lipoprotein SlyB